jgi:hypothetical protein
MRIRKITAAVTLVAAATLGVGTGVGAAEAHDNGRKHPHINVVAMNALRSQPAFDVTKPDGTVIHTPNGKALVKECFADVNAPLSNAEIRQLNRCFFANMELLS